MHAALGQAATVVNVGAGTGSYEPTDRFVVAVEPSAVMLAQRTSRVSLCVQGAAEALPFADNSFDGAMAVLTVHHWRDPGRGLGELRRVARQRVVVLTYDVDALDHFWVTHYFPTIAELDRGRFLSVNQMAGLLGGASVVPVSIPADCVDGFLGAFWRRPEGYLDAEVRAAISGFALMDRDALRRGVQRLAQDLASGAWNERFGELLALDELDLGYRLVIADAD